MEILDHSQKESILSVSFQVSRKDGGLAGHRYAKFTRYLLYGFAQVLEIKEKADVFVLHRKIAQKGLFDKD